MPLLLLAWLYTPDEKPNLSWLQGGWHDPEHPSTRLIWTSGQGGGALGLLTSEGRTMVLSIATDGRLSVRDLGPHLTENSPLQEQPLLEQGPQELTYGHAHLSYLNTRTDSGALQLEWKGARWNLQRDS